MTVDDTERQLFISFGPAIECSPNPQPDDPKDCVEDGKGVTVECPFPQAIRAAELAHECAMDLGFDPDLQEEMGRGGFNFREALTMGTDPDVDPAELVQLE